MKNTLSLAAGGALIIVGCALAVPHSPPWAVILLTLALLVSAQVIRIPEKDRLVLRIFAGIPLVIALASTWFWAGVIAQCGILVLILEREEMIPTTGWHITIFGAALAILAIGAVIDISNHMMAPVLVVIAGALGITGILWVQLYRLERTYRSEFS